MKLGRAPTIRKTKQSGTSVFCFCSAATTAVSCLIPAVRICSSCSFPQRPDIHLKIHTQEPIRTRCTKHVLADYMCCAIADTQTLWVRHTYSC